MANQPNSPPGTNVCECMQVCLQVMLALSHSLSLRPSIAVTGTFHCTFCQTEVEEDESAVPKKDARTLVARFNEQIEPIYVLLRETEDVNLSHELLEPEPTEIPALKQRLRPILLPHVHFCCVFKGGGCSVEDPGHCEEISHKCIINAFLIIIPYLLHSIQAIN